MLEVDVTDLFRAIVEKDTDAIGQWLCRVRDVDCAGAKTRKVSKACEAIVQSLVRLFCARYLTRSLMLVDTFKHLLVACVDVSIDLHARWQRVANMCAFMACNAEKNRTIHVYPALESPTMELDEYDEKQKQPKMSCALLGKTYAAYCDKLVQSLNSTVTPCVTKWLESDDVNNPTFAAKFVALERLLRARRVKEAHRMVTAIVLLGKDVRTTFHADVIACVWHVLCNVSEDAATSRDVHDYVCAVHSVYRTMLPPKRNARICRLALLYYAIIVLCDGRTRHQSKPPTAMTINLPVTVPSSMAYLAIFPSIQTSRVI
jgi:hypothetical protein